MNSISSRGLRLGLTGGMGCGKTTAASVFRELGFGVLESDEIVREIWEKDAGVKKAAVKRWGSGIKYKTKKSEYRIDRRKVARIVFGNTGELEWLEGLLHPLVRARWQGAIEAEPRCDWVVEIPLLFEKSLASAFDFTLCVWASPAQQAERLRERGLSGAEMAARQARQWPLQRKADEADFVVLNDGSLDFLRRQIGLVASRLRKDPS